MKTKSASTQLIDLRMREWQIPSHSRRIQTSLRRVLSQLSTEALLRLEDPRLEVRVLSRKEPLPGEDYIVWAYFPISNRRVIARRLMPREETRILLVFSEPLAETETAHSFECHLRGHLGHTLLYLRKPGAPNECADAMKEWRSCSNGRS